ncbi:MAG: thymidine kinase [Saprospiraceae bacterium]
MFLEPSFRGQRSGWIEIITGCMFSGKSEELIRRLKRAQIANQNLICFKPIKDDRYADEQVVSHDSNSQDSISIEKSTEILKYVEQSTNIIGIDEGQFFDMDIVEVTQKLALSGKRVVVAGLDLDFRGIPFGPMPHLMAVAEYVTKVHAICPHCGNLATHSYRLSEETDTVVIGEKDKYEPRCRMCYSMGNILDFSK